MPSFVKDGILFSLDPVLLNNREEAEQCVQENRREEMQRSASSLPQDK